MADYGKAAFDVASKNTNQIGVLSQTSRIKGLLATGLNKWLYAVSHAKRENKQLNIVCALDSLSQGAGGTSYIDFLRPKIQNTLGDGGLGFTAFNTSATTFEGVSYGITGGNQYTNAQFDPVGSPNSIYNPNLYSAVFVNATNGSVNFEDRNHIFTDATCYYLKQPGGGSFIWRDGKYTPSATNVDTSDTIKSVASVTRAGFPSSASNLVQAVGVTGNVHLIGVDLKRGTKGVRVHRLAQGGTQTRQVAQLDAATYTNFLKSIGCDLYILNAGMNDSGSSITDAQYDTDVREILTRVRNANPNTAILIIMPNETSDTAVRNLKLETYRQKLLKVALDFDALIFDTRWLMGNYANAYSKGFMLDGVHPNTTLNTILGEAIYNYIGGDYLVDVDKALIN